MLQNLPRDHKGHIYVDQSILEDGYLADAICNDEGLYPSQCKSVVDVAVGGLSPLLSAVLPAAPDPSTPEVGIRDWQRANSVTDLWDFAYGFSYALIKTAKTDYADRGTNSQELIGYCRANLTNTQDIFWYDWYTLFDDTAATFPTGGGNSVNEFETWQVSLQTIFDLLHEILKWPFGMVYSCYWGAIIGYLPLTESELPSLVKLEDDWLPKLFSGQLAADWI